MNNKVICPNCHALYAEYEAMELDGICEHCGYELQIYKEEIEEEVYPMSLLQNAKKKYRSVNPEMNNMLKNLESYGQDEVWHSIELLKQTEDRIKERNLFFGALKLMNKKFELWE